MGAPSLIVFDVNETLLDLSPLRIELESIFGLDPPMGEWFARLLHRSLVANALDRFRPFGDLAVEALIDVAVRRGLSLRDEEAVEALSPMRRLPPHPDVLPGVERLATAGRRMVALTNGSSEVANAQIRHAGLAGYLERVVSVDEVGVFKPHPAPYLHTAEMMDVHVGDMVLVAAHDWDCAGAKSAGARAIFVERPGAAWGIPELLPEATVADIVELADLIDV